jgi:hypothetical protein
MRCDEFEQSLQEQADGSHAVCDEATLREHARNCPACHELDDGFRFIIQGFAASRIPAPSDDLTDRIVAAAEKVRSPTIRLRRSIGWLAAAASLLAALGLWSWRSNLRTSELALVTNQPFPTTHHSSLIPGAPGLRSTHHSPLTTHHSPVPDEPLFPELADALSGDPRDSVVLVDAVEPISEIFRAVGRSLGSPVRPIAVNATEALGNLIKDIPEPDSPMMSMPGVRELMPQPMKRKMGEMGPSS